MKKAKLLWIDLEMTGLDPNIDRILEVAAIATDMDLNTLATFEAVVKVDEDLMKQRMVGEFWEKNAASRDALFAQNASGRPVSEVEKSLIEFVTQNFSCTLPLPSSSCHSERAQRVEESLKSRQSPIYLAGNSIHQDRKFIAAEMPTLDHMLHYRMLDVSAWKIYFENAKHLKFKKPENHRALDDINGSIEELKWYLTFLK